MSYTHRRSSTYFDVYYEDVTLVNGDVLADAVLRDCERQIPSMAKLFVKPDPHKTPQQMLAELLAQLKFTVYVDPNDLGGSHGTICFDQTIKVGAYGGPASADQESWVCMQVMAEVVEVLAAIHGGWDCGYNTGEALSRVLSTELYQDALGKWATVHTWLDGSRADWVNNVTNTDKDDEATGCAVAFLYWLHYQLGYSWEKIIAAEASTGLAQTYYGLVVDLTKPARPILGHKAWDEFSKLVFHEYPDKPCGLTTDNFFPIVPKHPKYWVPIDVLASSWMIIVGALLLTPAGVFCIACGTTILEPGYIGRVPTVLVALVSVATGVAGLVKKMSKTAAARE